MRFFGTLLCYRIEDSIEPRYPFRGRQFKKISGLELASVDFGPKVTDLALLLAHQLRIYREESVGNRPENIFKLTTPTLQVRFVFSFPASDQRGIGKIIPCGLKMKSRLIIGYGSYE